MQRSRRYDSAFRSEALALVMKGGRSLSQISRDIGVPMQTLWNWYNADMAKNGKRRVSSASAPSAEETAEQKIARLERENAHLRKKNEQLEMDRAILKKAAAFFARESE